MWAGVKNISKWAMHVKQNGQVGRLWAARLGLIVLLAALIAGVYLVQASQMSSVSRRLEVMRAQYDQLKRENAELLYQISQDGNIANLQRRAAEKGFIPAERVVYVPVTLAPATP